jgi:hypothetical protein
MSALSEVLVPRALAPSVLSPPLCPILPATRGKVNVPKRCSRQVARRSAQHRSAPSGPMDHLALRQRQGRSGLSRGLVPGDAPSAALCGGARGGLGVAAVPVVRASTHPTGYMLLWCHRCVRARTQRAGGGCPPRPAPPAACQSAGRPDRSPRTASRSG